MRGNTAQLSQRLRLVASFVEPGSRVADVGADHGYLNIFLVQQGISPGGLALDVNDGPLMRARAHVEEAGLTDRIQVRKSDGLQAVRPGEADVAVIAGMGGPLIEEILSASLGVARSMSRLVLSPQSEIGQVRRFLYGAGFEILDEGMALDGGKFYTVICARYIEGGAGAAGSLADVTPAQWQFGWVLPARRDPVLHQFLLREKAQYEEVEARLRSPQNPRQQARLGQVRERLSQIRETLLAYDPDEEDS